MLSLILGQKYSGEYKEGKKMGTANIQHLKVISI